MNNSKKMPYLLAAGAIGGAVGYLFFTDSGRRVVDNISRLRVEKTARIPEKIEDLRGFIANRGKDVTGVVRTVVDRVKGSVATGQQAYNEAGGIYQNQVDKLHRSNEEVVANLHRAVDNLGRLMHTAQETFLHPLYEMGAIVRGVDRGVRDFAKSTERRPFSVYREPQRGVR
jgi:hypothetical protein